MNRIIEQMLDDRFIEMWTEDNFGKEDPLSDRAKSAIIGAVGVGRGTMDKWVEYVSSLGMEFLEHNALRAAGDEQNVYVTDPATTRMELLLEIKERAESGPEKVAAERAKNFTPLYIAIPRETAEKILVLGALP